MSAFPDSPSILKGGLVLLDPVTSTVTRVIVLQYNPDSLSRTLQAQGAAVDASGGDRSEVLRLKGPPIETLKLEAEIDATDQLETNDQAVLRSGIFPQLAALETILYPPLATILSNHALASAGVLEIIPMEAPLTLFVWSAQRIVPVRITEFSVVEDTFDERLNPIRAKVTLGMRVLSVDDLGFAHPGGTVFLGHLRRKEGLAARSKSGELKSLGIGAIR